MADTSIAKQTTPAGAPPAGALRAPASSTRMPEGVQVKPRVPHYEFADRSIPRYWYDGSPFVTHFWDAMSTLFPQGEYFFVRSVDNFKDQVEDPALKKQMKGFAGQEHTHARLHGEFNDRLERLGYRVKPWDKMIGRSLAFGHKYLPKKVQLAFTVAAEHFTAILAEQAMFDPDVAGPMHAKVRSLWQWHAVEEMEHKAVAFDVYEAVGGSYGMRVLAMGGVTVGYLAGTFAYQSYMMARDGKLLDPVDFSKGVWWLLGKPGFLRKAMGEYFAFFRADFHPWERDCSGLIKAGEAALLEGGVLRPKKATA